MPRRKKFDLDGRCERCLQQIAHCVCSDIPSIQTQTQFLLIRHWKERRKPSNTGRLVDFALPNSTLFDYGAPGERWDPTVLSVAEPALLFPDPDAPVCDYRPRTVIVVDGSWPQARKLINKLPGLKTMPRLAIHPPSEQRTRLRNPPLKDGMSTIEAVAAAIDVLEGTERGDPLRTLYDRVVHGATAARGRPLHR
jgi:DTW domain-containing protein YfiP